MRSIPHRLSSFAPLVLLGVAACTAPTAPSTAAPSLAPDAGPAVGDAADAGAAPLFPHVGLAPLPAFQPGMSAYDPEPACPPALVLGAGERLSASTAAADFGLSVTPDELSAAWMTESDGGAVTVHYVDRATAAEPFAAARTVTGAFEAGRVALSSDGLELAVVDAGGLGFSVLRRDARSEAFGEPEVGPFEVLDAQGSDVLAPAGERYADPLFANGDRYFVFARVSANGAGTVYVGSRFFDTAPFSPGTPFAEEALAPSGAKRKTVTGASADVRTLFVWDEAASKSVVVRLSARGDVEGTTDLGAARDVQPTADCRVFWFTSGSPADVRRFAAP